MNCSKIVKIPVSCASLHAYLIDESLLIYSEITQSVYGFEKGNAFLFLQIDELVGSYSYEDILEQFPALDSVVVKKCMTLLTVKKKRNL